MNGKLLIACLYVGLGLLVLTPTLSAEPPVKIILDMDLCEDVDDAGALAVLHALADRKEAQILAVMISSNNEYAAPCADAINTWYGRPDVPIGYQRGLSYGYRNTKDPDRITPSTYVQKVSDSFPHDLKKSSDAPDAALLYRQLLAAQPDQSVTIVTVGFLVNLKNLLDSQPDQHSPLNGEMLAAQKVKQWVCMGGFLPPAASGAGQGEYNLMWDTAASVRAVNDWPTPVVFSGFYIGANIKVGACMEKTPETNPVRACYQYYNGLNNREAWDQTAVLFAVRGAEDYWTLSEPGCCVMHARVPHGYSEWIPANTKQHRYLIEKKPVRQMETILEDLMTQSPLIVIPTPRP